MSPPVSRLTPIGSRVIMLDHLDPRNRPYTVRGYLGGRVAVYRGIPMEMRSCRLNSEHHARATRSDPARGA